MKVNRTELKTSIEYIIGEGVVNGEEIDVTTKKVMDEIEILIKAVEHERLTQNSNKPKWIKLSDRKPKSMTSLWVSDGHSSAEACCWFDGVIESPYDTFDTLENMKEITHFIELPDKLEPQNQ